MSQPVVNGKSAAALAAAAKRQALKAQRIAEAAARAQVQAQAQAQAGEASPGAAVSRSASAVVRVLCLHGYLQSAATFSHKLSALQKAFKKASIQLDFLQGPLAFNIEEQRARMFNTIQYVKKQAETNYTHTPHKEETKMDSTQSNTPTSTPSQEDNEEESSPHGDENETPIHQPPAQNTAPSIGESTSSDGLGYGWWLWNDERTVYTKWRESLHHLRQHVQTHGPYDVLLGFSQGGAFLALAAQIYHFQKHFHLHQSTTAASPPAFPSRPAFLGEEEWAELTTSDMSFLQQVQGLIFVSAFAPRVPHLRILAPSVPPTAPTLDVHGQTHKAHHANKELYEKYHLSLPVIPLPSLHIIGQTDEIVPPVESVHFAVGNFAHPQLEYHAGGHFVPSSSSMCQVYKDFILKCSHHHTHTHAQSQQQEQKQPSEQQQTQTQVQVQTQTQTQAQAQAKEQSSDDNAQ